MRGISGGDQHLDFTRSVRKVNLKTSVSVLVVVDNPKILCYNLSIGTTAL
jgi:hypothetical protein